MVRFNDRGLIPAIVQDDSTGDVLTLAYMNEDVTLQQPVVDALNDQIHKEFYSAYLYLGMSAHLESQGYEGFSRWMRLQGQEELAHGMRLYDYVLHRGERAGPIGGGRVGAVADHIAGVGRHADFPLETVTWPHSYVAIQSGNAVGKRYLRRTSGWLAS